MAFFNYVSKEITLKVVYYGPGLSGKTTNLQYLYSVLDPDARGKFISLATEADRTLFFDFLPVDLGKIKDFTLRFQLYTVPGQIRYNATRKLVLKGADAIVFVADSQRAMRDQNLESFANMRENLASNNIDPDGIPVVLQYNKRDLPNCLSIEELNSDLNKRNYQYIEAEAVNGKGVNDTFRLVTRALLKDISRKHKVDISPARDEGISIKIQEKTDFAVEETVPREEPEIVEAVTRPPQAAAPAGAFFPDEKLTALQNSLGEILQSLARIKETVSLLSDEMNETKGRQADLTRAVREMNSTLAKLKEKRRWFSFS